MKNLLNAIFALSLFCFMAAPAHAGKAPAKPAASKPAQPAKVDTEASIKALMEGYTMGMSKAEVAAKLKTDVEKYFKTLMDKERTPTGKDEVRKKMENAIAKIKQNTVEFTGKDTPWNTSIVDDQFAHRNNESMIANLTENQQKFFFFYNDKLYKIFIALPEEQYAGYTFPKFQSAIEQIYGKAQEEFEEGITGESELHHLLWKSSGNLHLWAMDKTGVYGNFVLVVLDNAVNEEVVAARKERGLKTAGYVNIEVNPIVKTVTEKPEPPKSSTPEPPQDSMKPGRGGK